jgi:hypothetical protein
MRVSPSVQATSKTVDEIGFRTKSSVDSGCVREVVSSIGAPEPKEESSVITVMSR